MGDDYHMPSQSVFGRDLIPAAAEDPLYSLVTAYENDECPDKIDLGVGAYRDNAARPWILPVVKKASQTVHNDPTANHEYIPIAGLAEFVTVAQRLMLGSDSVAIKESRVCTFQAVSGTGAVHLGGALLTDFIPEPKPSIYISKPSWPIHRQCFTHVRLNVAEYPYFSNETKMLDFEGMITALQAAPHGSIVLLHACAHNPTGVDPTNEQWMGIATVMRQKNHFPFFDCAYQGFASGSLETDSFAIRYFVDQGFETLIAQSFSKNMGLYGQRVGALHYVAAPGPLAGEITNRVASQLAIIQRSEISSPQIYGAKIASLILNDESLYTEWQQDLHVMASRISEMRHCLREQLVRLGTPGNWDHLVKQIGMFSFTGLSEVQVRELRFKWHVYMLGNGRISVAGLNTANVEYFARAIDDVVHRLG